jgi:TctA family transporter
VNSGKPRLTFGIPDVADGMDFVPVVVGLFGIGEVIANLGTSQDRIILAGKIKNLMPTWPDLKAAFPAMVRGTCVGTMLGILPGGGAALPPFAAYALEKKVSRHPERFGTGVIEGVASPESANNAGAQTSFIPLLTMGIPTNPLMALMIGALMIQGIQPGPSVIREQPALYWGLVASMWIGNLMLVIINLPLVGIWASLLRVPYRLLFPAIILFFCIGAYASSNSVFSVRLMLGWGALGYFFNKIGVQPAPMVLGFVLGPLLEENFRRAMLLSGGDPAVFVQRPISATLLAVAAILLVVLIFPAIRHKREEAIQE